jgi:hypothetical protein
MDGGDHIVPCFICLRMVVGRLQDVSIYVSTTLALYTMGV